MSDAMLAEPVKADPKVLKPSAFSGAEYAFATFSAVLPVGWTVEDALKPEFWVHVAGKFSKDAFTGDPDKAGAIIELRTIDHAFYARLYVRAVQERGLIVQMMGEPVYLGQQQVKTEGYEINWNVGKRGYDVIRKSDRSIVADGAKLKTKEQAQSWVNAA